MSCARTRQVLDAWLDGELDRATHAEIETHVQACTACSGLRDARISLRGQVRAGATYFRAPAALANAVRRIPGDRAGTRLRRGPTWLQAGALAACFAVVFGLAGYWFGRPLPERSLAELAVASHVASLSPSRQLTQVASADRHSVKPWFQGRLEFAPVVRDLSADGYVLVGGRLDHVADRQAAAIVYRVRQHVVNLFIWRAAQTSEESMTTTNVRGFNVTTWTSSGLSFAAVSDVEARDLARFASLVHAEGP